MSQQSTNRLNRTIERWDAVAVNITIVLGIGIFVVPSEVAKYLSSPCMIILVWVAGGVISLLGAMCYSEIASSFPVSGGDYIYLRESYGRLAGFLFGWTELLVIRTGSIAAVAFIFARYTKSFISVEDGSWLKPMAVISIAVLACINIISVHYSKKVHYPGERQAVPFEPMGALPGRNRKRRVFAG